MNALRRPTGPRICKGCGGGLNLYNSRAYCGACELKERNRGAGPAGERPNQVKQNPCADEVMDLANFLLEQPSRWKVMGIDLMFFHQFFNEGLERELRTMRWQLYGREDPPMPLSPQEAANYFGRFMEPTPGRLSERATEREAFFRPIADSLVTLELRQLIRLAASGDQSKLDAIADELEAEIKQIAKDLAFTDAVIEQRMDAFGRTIEELLARNLVSDSAMVNVSLGPRLLILVVPIGQQDAFEKSEVFWRSRVSRRCCYNPRQRLLPSQKSHVIANAAPPKSFGTTTLLGHWKLNSM